MDERLKVEVFADATDVRLSVGIREGSVAFELIFGGWGRRIEDASRRRCNANGVEFTGEQSAEKRHRRGSGTGAPRDSGEPQFNDYTKYKCL